MPIDFQLSFGYIEGMITRRRASKYVLWGLLGLAVFTAGWYLAVRLVSPWTVVTIVPPESTATTASAESFDTLRVGCWNIAHGRGGRLGTANWQGGSRDERRQRLEQIADLLKEANLDIVVLNEVDFACFWSGHVDQSKVIARRAGYPFIVRQKNVDVGLPGVSLRFGNAILSRFPITDAEFLDFPNPSLVKELFVGGMKDGVAAAIDLPDGSRLQVVAVHLSLEGETVRNDSVEMILDLRKKDGLPMVAMGDFNSTAAGLPNHRTDPAGSNCIDTLLASGQLRTLPQGPPADPNALTFPSEDPKRIIDWIFVSPEWHIAEKQVLQSTLSDHRPVIMTLTKK